MRNNDLDGLRGLAALTVALGHCVTEASGLTIWSKSVVDFAVMPWTDVLWRLGHVLFPADAAVIVFFVLSGYVLWASMLRRGDKIDVLAVRFVIARCYCLLPMAIASAIMLAFLIDVRGEEVARSALLLSYSTNRVLWPLQVEVLGSGVLLATFLIFSLSRYAFLPIAMALAILAWNNPHYLLLFLPTFLLGAAIHHLPTAWFRSRLLLATAYAILVMADLVLQRGVMTRFVTYGATLILVASIVAHPLPILGSRLAQFLGKVSYPFYLLHTAGLIVGHWVLAQSGSEATSRSGTFPALVAISVGLTIPGAYLAHHLIEKPGMRAGASLLAALPWPRRTAAKSAEF